eukprot:jgi/Galph1/2965/GphlegSOOS_G1616.1
MKTKHSKNRKRKRTTGTVEIERHPLGIRPLGNLLIASETADGLLLSSPKTSREASLGYFSILNDQLLTEVLTYCEHWHAVLLQQISVCLLFLQRTLERVGIERLFRNNSFPYRLEDHYMLRAEKRNDKKIVEHKISYEEVYSDFLYQSWQMVCFRFDDYPTWFKRNNIQRYHVNELDVRSFIDQFERANLPVIIQGEVCQWPAYQKWNRSYLLETCGDFPFSVGPTKMTMTDYIHYMDSHIDGNPLYLFEKNFCKLSSMALDYQSPLYFQNRDFREVYGKRPDHRWLIYGPCRSGSRFHIDPNQTCAWNAVIRGRKKWVLFPPSCPPPGVFPNEDYSQVVSPIFLLEWFTSFYEEARKRKEMMECVVEAGEMIFIPRGWWHIVINLEESLAITENYVAESNLSSVLEFLEKKRDQVSGWHDKEDLRTLLVKAIQKQRPDLLKMYSLEKLSMQTYASKANASYNSTTCQPNKNRNKQPFVFNFLRKQSSD